MEIKRFLVPSRVGTKAGQKYTSSEMLQNGGMNFKLRLPFFPSPQKKNSENLS